MRLSVLSIVLFAVLLGPQQAYGTRRYSQKRPEATGGYCKFYAADAGRGKVLSSSAGLSCSQCTRKCLDNKDCAGVTYPTLTVRKGFSYIPRNSLLNDACNTNKCGTTWAALSSSPASTPAASCNLYSDGSNLRASDVLSNGQASCTGCLSLFLSRPEFKSVTWAGLPPVIPSKIAIIEKYGGQLTGGDGTVTGAYIPDLQAQAVAAQLCTEMGTTLKSLGDVMCPPPGPKPPTPPPAYKPPRPRYPSHGSSHHADFNSGRRLTTIDFEPGTDMRYSQEGIDAAKSECGTEGDQYLRDRCYCQVLWQPYAPWPISVMRPTFWHNPRDCTLFCFEFYGLSTNVASVGFCDDGLEYDHWYQTCVWPGQFDQSMRCNIPGL